MKPALELLNLLEGLDRKRTSVIDLVTAGIATLATHRAAHPQRDIFKDRSLEILSRVEIDVPARAVGVASAMTPAAR